MLTLQPRRSPAWKQLYNLEGITLALFIGFLPAMKLGTDTLGGSALLPLASIYSGLLLFLQRKAIDWRCPRCGKAFLRRKGNGRGLPFRTHCGTCHLRRGSERLD